MQLFLSVFLYRTQVIKNLCKVPIYYKGAFTANEPFQLSSLKVMPGEEITISAEQLGCPDNKYLLLFNKNAVELGAVKITLS